MDGGTSQRSLNEGRSVNPGDTSVWADPGDADGHAQRRPERQPRRHPEPSPAQRVAGLRSTKAGASTPATLAYGRTLATQMGTLNEGRSVNPGDTLNRLRHNELQGSAQRRPERQPRRHLRADAEGLWVASQHAQRRPERQPRRHVKRLPPARTVVFHAQRRPERQPRRHVQSGP